MKKNHVAMLASLCVMLARTVAAQDTFNIQIAGDPTQQGDVIMFTRPVGQAEMGLLAVEPFDLGRPVVGRPYSATAVTEFSQVLGDGNRIEHQTSAAIARDGRGRVRREHQATFVGPMSAERENALVTITDPTTGAHITLDQSLRLAHRATIKPFTTTERAKVRTVVEEGSSGRAVPAPPEAMATAGATKARTERLGTRDIEGLRAEGTRTTMTVPAGAIGNQLPLETVSERWYSPELQVVVMTRRSDPRFGETVYRLTNVVRGEPSPDLFEVPAGYQVREPRR